MIELALSREDFARVRSALVGENVEGCAVFFASQTTRVDGLTRLLVRDIHIAEPDDYSRRGGFEAELTPHLVARVTKRARREGLALVFVHSHPGKMRPAFSSVDSTGEEHLSKFLAHRHPAAHVALVLSAGGVRARKLGSSDEIRVVTVGTHRDVLSAPRVDVASSADEVFDRQVRAFGVAGQREIQSLRVAIVGLGGTGSIVSQQLVHLGVRDFILVDPDVIEATNLNRVASALRDDVGTPKVDVAARYIQSVAPDAKVERLRGDIIRTQAARELLEADFIFGCTDSHGSRAVLQQIAYQYLIPCIDMGTTIAASNGGVTHIYGRVQLLGPGLACFTCSGLLDGNEVRRDMMTAFERKADPYLSGAREPAPAVMSLNATVASLAITMLLATVTGVPSHGRYLLYNAMLPSLRSIQSVRAPNCYVCSPAGCLARGDEWPILARRD